MKIDLVKLLALPVSMLSLVATALNYYSQNSKWDILNQPRFMLTTTPYFTAFDELEAPVAYSRDWGYDTWLTYVQANGVRSPNKVRRYSELVWVLRVSS